MASDELKPCPHCNGPVSFHQDDECDGCHYIHCASCDAFFDFATGADPEKVAETVVDLRELCAVAWNRRAQDFDAMRQRAEKAERDAARYRWITENADVDCRGHAPDGDFNSLDERIDAALAQQVKP